MKRIVLSLLTLTLLTFNLLVHSMESSVKAEQNQSFTDALLHFANYAKTIADNILEKSLTQEDERIFFKNIVPMSKKVDFAHSPTGEDFHYNVASIYLGLILRKANQMQPEKIKEYFEELVFNFDLFLTYFEKNGVSLNVFLPKLDPINNFLESMAFVCVHETKNLSLLKSFIKKYCMHEITKKRILPFVICYSNKIPGLTEFYYEVSKQTFVIVKNDEKEEPSDSIINQLENERTKLYESSLETRKK